MQRAIITGGQGGLARAIVAALRRDGWQVDAPGREVLNVDDEAQVRRYFDERQVDLLVCNAGVTRDVTLARMSEAAWDEVWRTNFQGAARCARAAAARMGSGAQIVFLSSRSALHPPVGQAAYAAAKAALLGLTRDLAHHFGPAGIRVNTILPGFLETAMTAGVSASRRSEVRADHALGRFNTPEAVADFLVHLQTAMPHTSGQIFQLDSRC